MALVVCYSTHSSSLSQCLWILCITLKYFTMTLAKWARKEEPKPGSLKTRTDVDEWLLPDISRFDTIHTVLDRYLLF